ncbi:MAG: hypothetical protein ACLFNY_01345 [Candidatus Aenigmatarchaeota archaeon]
MVDVEKAVMAIEEKKRWEKREEEILEDLEEVRKKRKELKKRAKKLKKRINEAGSAIKSIKQKERSVSDPSINLLDDIRRM